MDILKDSETVAEKDDELISENIGMELGSKSNDDILTNTGIVGPPSPLTGCYLMIILAEPFSDHHKDVVLQWLVKGFLSWDSSDYHVDLADELNIIANNNPDIEEGRNGEKLIQYASENLVTEILIHPTFSTFIQCMRNMLSSFTRHKHIIHSGYTFSGNGSWILQDGTFSVSDFVDIFHKHDVQRVLHAYPDTISINIHCSDCGLWSTLPDKSFTKICKIKVNPVDVMNSGDERINNFIEYLSPIIVPTTINELLETSDVVGNIRFSHPTLYVFPGGQGDAALFGINGFNMLIDGGFNRKACFWDFVRHLDRLDAVLLTRLNNSTVNGISAILERKLDTQIYPQIGHFFCNIPDTKNQYSSDGGKDKNDLIVDLMERGYSLVQNLKKLNLKPHNCFQSVEPINLYHKVGHGTLDMYVVSPSKDSKEVKDFITKWNNQDKLLFSAKDSRHFSFPLQNIVSICALLVWQPANPNDPITRILFPGSTPGPKIQEGLQKLKNMEFMKYSTCSKSSLTSAKASKRPVKSTITEKSKVLIDKDNKLSSDNTKIKHEIIPNESISDNAKTENLSADEIMDTKKEDAFEQKAKIKSQKPSYKPKPEVKAVKTMDRKINKDSVTSDKKNSPSTTPKRIGRDIKSKNISRTTKSNLGEAAPKSAKDANNLKVLESKQKLVKGIKKDVSNKTVSDKKELKPEKKPISRRSRGLSPLKKVLGSPIKAAKLKSETKKGYSDNDVLTADSSAISSPSNEDICEKTNEPLTKTIDEEKQRELDDLKEEQEVVREIEEVFNRSERLARRSIIKQDSATEVEEEEEYLIIEKEEIDQYTEDSINEPESSITKEEEFLKHQRDSQESEKQRKSSVEKEKVKEVTPIDYDIEKESIKNLNDELQEIITTAKDIVTTQTGEMDKYIDKPQENLDGKELVPQESIPEDKCSATVESGATTTAPTLPEDERITMDEIKKDITDEKLSEDNEVKPKDVDEVPLIKPLKNVLPIKMVIDTKSVQLKDMVKTPDEVADLPMHEEVDLDSYEKDIRSKEDQREVMPSEVDQLSLKEVIHLNDNEKDNVVSFNNEEIDGSKEVIDGKQCKEDEVLYTASSPIDNAGFEVKGIEEIKDIAEDKNVIATIQTDQYEKHSFKETVSSPIDIPEESNFEIIMVESELRETHITNVSSPIIQARDIVGKTEDLHDIAEEEEERKLSSPSIDSKLQVNVENLSRPLSPREEEVAKIVADVAKVLKSDKDITEIIPNFDENELERKIGETSRASPSDMTKNIEVEKTSAFEVKKSEQALLISESYTDEQPIIEKDNSLPDFPEGLTAVEGLTEQISEKNIEQSKDLLQDQLNDTIENNAEMSKMTTEDVTKITSVAKTESSSNESPKDNISKTDYQESVKDILDSQLTKSSMHSSRSSSEVENIECLISTSHDSLISATCEKQQRSGSSSPKDHVIDKSETGITPDKDTISIKSPRLSVCGTETFISEPIKSINAMIDSTSNKSEEEGSDQDKHVDDILENLGDSHESLKDSNKSLIKSEELTKEKDDSISQISSEHASPQRSEIDESKQSRSEEENLKELTLKEKTFLIEPQEPMKEILNTPSKQSSEHSSPKSQVDELDTTVDGNLTQLTTEMKKSLIVHQEPIKDIAGSISPKSSEGSSPQKSGIDENDQIENKLKTASHESLEETTVVLIESEEPIKEIMEPTSKKSSEHSSPQRSEIDEKDEIDDNLKKLTASDESLNKTTEPSIESKEPLKDMIEPISKKSSEHSSPQRSEIGENDEIDDNLREITASDELLKETTEPLIESKEPLKDMIEPISKISSEHSSPQRSEMGENDEIDDNLRKLTDSDESLKETTEPLIESKEPLKDMIESISKKSSEHSSPQRSEIGENDEIDENLRKLTTSDESLKEKTGPLIESKEPLKDIIESISKKSSEHSSPQRSEIGENDEIDDNLRKLSAADESLKETTGPLIESKEPLKDMTKISSEHSSPQISTIDEMEKEKPVDENLKELTDSHEILKETTKPPVGECEQNVTDINLKKITVSHELLNEVTESLLESQANLKTNEHSSSQKSEIDESDKEKHVYDNAKELIGSHESLTETTKSLSEIKEPTIDAQDVNSEKNIEYSSPNKSEMDEKEGKWIEDNNDKLNVLHESVDEISKSLIAPQELMGSDKESKKSSEHSSPQISETDENGQSKIVVDNLKELNVSYDSLKETRKSLTEPEESTKDVKESTSKKSSERSSPQISTIDEIEKPVDENLKEFTDSHEILKETTKPLTGPIESTKDSTSKKSSEHSSPQTSIIDEVEQENLIYDNLKSSIFSHAEIEGTEIDEKESCKPESDNTRELTHSHELLEESACDDDADTDNLKKQNVSYQTNIQLDKNDPLKTSVSSSRRESETVLLTEEFKLEDKINDEVSILKDGDSQLLTGSLDNIKDIAEIAHTNLEESLPETISDVKSEFDKIDQLSPQNELLKETKDSLSNKSSANSSPKGSASDVLDVLSSQKDETPVALAKSQESLNERSICVVEHLTQNSENVIESIENLKSDIKEDIIDVPIVSSESLKKTIENEPVKSSEDMTHLEETIISSLSKVHETTEQSKDTSHSSPEIPEIDKSEPSSLHKEIISKALTGSNDSLKEIAKVASLKSSEQSSPQISISGEISDIKSIDLTNMQELTIKSVESNELQRVEESNIEGTALDIKVCDKDENAKQITSSHEPLKEIISVDLCAQESSFLPEQKDHSSKECIEESRSAEISSQKTQVDSSLKDECLKEQSGSNESLKEISSLKSSAHSSRRVSVCHEHKDESPVKFHEEIPYEIEMKNKEESALQKNICHSPKESELQSGILSEEASISSNKESEITKTDSAGAAQEKPEDLISVNTQNMCILPDSMNFETETLPSSSELLHEVKTVDNNEIEDISSFLKDTRSKSVSDVMITSVYKTSIEAIPECISESGETAHKTPPTAPVSPGNKSEIHSNFLEETTEKWESTFPVDREQTTLVEEESDTEIISKKSMTMNDPMSTSVYGDLVITPKDDPSDSDTQLPDVYKFLDEAELNFKKALDEHVQLRGADVMTTVTSKYEITDYEEVSEENQNFVLEEIPKSTTKPEGNTSNEDSKDGDQDFVLEKDWGKPSNLPSPSTDDLKTTPKKEKRAVLLKTKINNEKNLKKMSDITNKDKKVSPVYVDLTYVPHQSNGYYSHLDFFKNVRARYYVFSSTDPHREVLQALLDAKQSWEDKNLEVTIIPTYDTDTLGYWVSQNEELLAQHRIDLSPSASRCTINLQDHETSCSAYRLEF